MIEKNEMIFGVRAVIEAIQAGKEIDKVLVKKDIQSDLSKELFAVLKETFIPVQRVPVERINRITKKNHQGVVAFISPITYQRTEDIVPFLFEQGKNPLLIMLDGLTDVRNFGAIARTCECAGVDAIIIPSKNSVSVNADAIKTSAGALHTIPVCRENNLTNTIKFLKDSISASAYYRTRFIGLIVEESTQTYSQCTCQLYKRSERRNINIFLDTCNLFYGKPCAVCQFFQTYFFCCSKAFYFFSNNVGSIHSI